MWFQLPLGPQGFKNSSVSKLGYRSSWYVFEFLKFKVEKGPSTFVDGPLVTY